MSDNLDTHFDEVETNDFPNDPPTPERDRGDELREYAIDVDPDGNKITRFPDGSYVMGHATPAMLNEFNRLLAELDEQRAVIERLKIGIECAKPLVVGWADHYRRTYMPEATDEKFHKIHNNILWMICDEGERERIGLIDPALTGSGGSDKPMTSREARDKLNARSHEIMRETAEGSDE